MTARNRIFSALATALLGASAFAQANFPELEPNSQKSEATPVLGIVASDTISGTSTGTTTTLGLTTGATVDVFRVKTGLLALGIYKHRLAITTTGTAGHTGTIRGLTQAAGVAGTADATVQTSSTTSSPARFNQWYGFGKQEEIYYRVAGTSATTAGYVATLSTTPVTPTPVAGTFSSLVTITTLNQTTANTIINLFDSNYDAIPGGSNDNGVGGGSTLTRCLNAGTYYVAIGGSNQAWNYTAPPDDLLQTGNLMDFSGSLVASTSSTLSADYDFTVTDGTTTTPVINQLPALSSYDTTWWSITVGAPAVPANDSCAGAIAIPSGTVFGNISAATHDGTASCDPGGLSSNDVWYSFTNNSGGPSVMSANTCGSTGIDTVVTVFDACAGTELGCSDDCGGSPCGGATSCVTGVPLLTSQTVIIRVSDRGLGGGCFQLNLINAPNHDNCAAAVPIVGPGVYQFDTTGASTGTEGQVTTTGCGSPPRFDLWYTYTPTKSGTVTIDTCNQTNSSPSPDTKIAVHAVGCPLVAGITCNDDASPTCSPGSTLQSRVTFTAVCGSTYSIQIGRFFPTTNPVYGTFTVTELGSTACSTPFTSYCSGDGTDTTCPCANPGLAGRGCDNTVASGGAIITSTGTASVSADTLVLIGTGAVPFGPGLFYQGSLTANPTAPFGVTFGNGLRCAGGATPRLEIRGADGVGASATTVAIHILGTCAAGDVRNYQLWYRDSPNFGSCTAGFNLSNAITLTWAP